MANEAIRVESLIVEAQNLIAHARQSGHVVVIMQGPHGPIVRIKKAIGNDPYVMAAPEVAVDPA